MDLHHVGIATPDADGLVEVLQPVLDVSVVHEEAYEDLWIVFLECGATYLELLEPTADGTVSRYLDRHGPGLHHVGFATTDIAGALATAQEHGIELIDETPRPGAWGHDVAFLHPESTGGVLIEFIEA